MQELPLPYQELESSRKGIAEKIIEMSVRGDLAWDFSNFDSDIFGQIAVAKKNGFTFVSTHLQDEGIEFSIFCGEGSEDTNEVDTFRGLEAFRVREILNKLAWLDKGYKERQLDKIREQASQELLNLEAFNEKRRTLNQALEILTL